MTTAEYLETPETVLPSELAFGVLRVADSPKPPHQRVVRDFVLALSPFVREQQLGELLFAPMDVILDAEADLIVQPDLMFISSARQSIVSDKVWGAPDLVIEVLSPAPRIGALEERVGWFARYGVRECWLASLVEKQIVVLTLARNGVAERTISTGGQPVRTRVFEGLRVAPADIFGW